MPNTNLNRRNFLRQFGRATAGCAALSLTSSLGAMAKSPKPHPNVLFIIADDLCTALGGYRHPQCRTPNLDRLAARGVLFENAYCHRSADLRERRCSAGSIPPHLNVLRNKVNFRDYHPNLVTLPQFFRNQGYTTARVNFPT